MCNCHDGRRCRRCTADWERERLMLGLELEPETDAERRDREASRYTDQHIRPAIQAGGTPR